MFRVLKKFIGYPCETVHFQQESEDVGEFHKEIPA